FAPEAYDLVFSATAFHWVEEAVGYPKVFAMLRHGGAFARFANRAGPDRGRPALWAEIQKLYGIYMPGSEMNRFGPQDAAAISAIAARYGFVDTRYALFARTRSF